MFTSTRTARTLLAIAALSLSGCAKLLGDFTYDPNAGAGQGGSGAGGNAGSLQGDIVVLPPNGLVTTEQGAKATFTIALKVKPKADVKVALQSSNEAEGIVSPASVSFTPDNYAAPQTVQVTGVDDMLMDRTQPYTIITSPASSDDAHYNGLDPIDPELKNVDDETAGFLVTPTTGLVTTESGGEATFTVVLTRAPTADVVIPLRSDNEAEGTISPRALTFTATNWMAPQTVTVTGVDDDATDKAQTYHVVTGAAFSSDGDYDKLDPDDITVVNQDNESAGVTLTPSTGLVTYEDGSMTSFGIALNSPPSKDVTIALSSSDEGEGLVTPSEVVFTPDNWMAPQVVTVTGVDDSIVDGSQPYLVVTAPAQSEDPGYQLFDAPDAEVSNVDNDSPSLVVMPMGLLLTSETGTAATFSVALASKPKGDVLLDVVSSRPQEGVVSPALLTFTDQNWNAVQVVTVTGVDDAAADGPQPYVVHVTPKPESVDTDYGMLLETDVSAVNADDDSPGITVMAGPSLTTTEGGGTATFTVALNSQPTADVKIDLSSNDTSEGTVGPATLVFTRDNYKAPQVVTIKGVSDDRADGNQPYRIITAPAVSNDPNYASLDGSNVDVSNIDDDSPGISVSAGTQTLTTSESGGTATFTVVLNSEPVADVTIAVSSSNKAEGTVSPASLKFTSANWRAPQMVTVKGVDDDGPADGAQPYRIELAKAQSNDTKYSPIDPPDVKVNNTDNDSAGISLKNESNLSTKETGSMASFQVVLNSKPAADVTIAISTSNGKEGTVTPASLKFTNANWGAPQTVTITGVNDDVADGNQVFRVVTGAAQSNDPNYNGWNAADPSVSNVDDDSPGITVAFTPSTGLSTKEDGTTASFTVVLDSQPTADVTIPIHTSNPKEGTVSPASLTFTAANWKSARTVTVTGADDSVADGAQPYSIVTEPATSTDGKYKGRDAQDVPVTNVDNESPGIAVSSVTPVTGTTNEGGATATFTVALNSEPKADVTVPLTSSNIKEGTVSPALLTFTPLNWQSAQKVTVTPVNDDVADGPQQYTIDIGPSGSKDATYVGRTATAVTLTNIDNDSAGITVTAVKGKTSEAGVTTTFTIKLNSQPRADVVIPLASNDPNEGKLSVAQVTFTPANYGSETTVTITGVDDDVADGDVGYAIVVGPSTSTDPDYKSLTTPNVAVINADNDSAGLNVSALEGTTSEKASAKAFTSTIALTSKPSADVTIPLTSTKPTEGAVSPASLTFTSANWKTPQTVTVTGVNDDVVDGSQSYRVQIGAATSKDKDYSDFDYPTDIALTNLDDDSAGIEVSLAAGSTSEKGGTTTFTIVLSSEPSAAVTIPLSSSNENEGTLDVTEVVFTGTNWSKPVTVTVKGVNDKIADGPQHYTIVTGAALSTDGNYKTRNADDVDVINTDDDVPGIDVSAAPGLTTSEAGGTAGSATFTVVLSTQPKSAVSIAIASDTATEGLPDVTKLDFTPGNWSMPQTVTVTGVNDDLVDGPVSYKIVLSPPTTNDAAYAALDPDDVTLINTDDDTVPVPVPVPAP